MHASQGLADPRDRLLKEAKASSYAPTAAARS